MVVLGALVVKIYHVTSWHEFCINCTKFRAVTKRSQMQPNTTKHIERLVQGLMGWIGCVRCEKSRRNLVARTFAIIALVHPVLHRVSCSYETIPNASKHYETHQNMSLGSVTKQTFVLIAPVQYVLHQVSGSYEIIPNAPKYYETHRNIGILSNGVDWLRSLQKVPT